jgi:hypothetical protein
MSNASIETGECLKMFMFQLQNRVLHTIAYLSEWEIADKGHQTKSITSLDILHTQ